MLITGATGATGATLTGATGATGATIAGATGATGAARSVRWGPVLRESGEEDMGMGAAMARTIERMSEGRSVLKEVQAEVASGTRSRSSSLRSRGTDLGKEATTLAGAKREEIPK